MTPAAKPVVAEQPVVKPVAAGQPVVKPVAAGQPVVKDESTEKLQKPTWASTDSTAVRTFAQAAHTAEGYHDPRIEARKTAYEEGMKKAKSTVDAVVAKYRDSIAQLQHLREQICQETEQQLVDLALLIAREVIQSDVSARREFTKKMVDDVLSMLREAHTITLRLSPTDCAAIKKARPELQSGSSVLRLVEDRACEIGGVIAEADLGRIDATVERRLSEVARQLQNPKSGGGAGTSVDDDLAHLLAQNDEVKP